MARTNAKRSLGLKALIKLSQGKTTNEIVAALKRRGFIPDSGAFKTVYKGTRWVVKFPWRTDCRLWKEEMRFSRSSDNPYILNYAYIGKGYAIQKRITRCRDISKCRVYSIIHADNDLRGMTDLSHNHGHYRGKVYFYDYSH